MAGARRVADELDRAVPGRELPRRVVDGRVLAFAAVRGLAGAPFFPLPFLPFPFFPLPFLTPLRAAAGLSAPDWATAPVLAEVLARAALLARLPELARGLLAGRVVLALAAEPLARPAADRPVVDRPAVDRVVDRPDADLLVDGLLADVRRAEDRAPVVVAVRRAAAGRRAGADAVAGWAADSDLAAEFRALAAVVIALVAVFTDCIAVDSVRADDVALVAAAVILVAAEVTLVAADETVRAAVADVGRPDEVRVVLRVPLVLPAAVRELVPLVRAVLVVVLRAVGLAAADRAEVLGRPAERCEPLVLSDRALAAPAGLRRAAARAVVCSGTDFPPS
jgi:hypothetical protein